MITTENLMEKVNKIRRLDDMIALNHYIDYLLYREQDVKTELGQSLIMGLGSIVNGKTFSIKSSQDILKLADEL